VGFFLESLLAHLHPLRVELYAYSNKAYADELTARIRPHFSAWREIHNLNDEQTAQLIHRDGIHILIDLSGHTAGNRLPVFAWKPAPVQVAWLGYFATTGVAEMDYLIADAAGVSASHRTQFSETVQYLPDTRLCFTPPVTELSVAPLPAPHNGYVTFGCFQNLSKLGDAVLAAWGRIFAALPTARLHLGSKLLHRPEIAQQLRDRLQRHGIAPDRVSLSGAVSRAEYLAKHANIDILLDTFSYPGGTTTCEALWMGVPTVTLAGDTLLSRQGVSLLNAAGLPDWVAQNEEDYVTKAVAFASDLHNLAELRAGLREQVRNSPLFDAPHFAHNFEQALWQMWQQRVAVLPATALPIVS
jgi:predicted O-linked N-acetylglucosamine transferase (SPINDLY family)